MKHALNSLCTTTLRCAAALQMKKVIKNKTPYVPRNNSWLSRGHTESPLKGKGVARLKWGKLPGKRICHRQVAKKEAEGRKSRPGLPDQPGGSRK